MSGELCFACPVHIPIFSILQLCIPELCVTQSDHIIFTWNGQFACAVSRDLLPGAKMIHIFRIPEPNLPIHFVTFTLLRRRLSHVIGEKLRFQNCEGYKVNCACARSRDLCTGGPPKPHVPILWPRIVYSLYDFYGATMMIKGSFILEHPHVNAVFGRKKLSSKSVPKMAVFRKFKGLNIKYSRDLQKALPYRNDVFWRTLRKNPFRGVGLLLITSPYWSTPKKRRKT